MIFYVATNGDDRWSGRLPAPNAAHTDGPLATLTGARDAIRRLRLEGALRGPVEVQVRSGVYLMSEPLRLGPGDSGTEQSPVTYRAFPGEQPILSGGRPIRGWEPYRDRIQQAHVPETRAGQWHFRQLFYQARRMIRSRRPKHDPADPLYGGWSFVEGIVPEDPALGPAAPAAPAARIAVPVAFSFNPGDFPAPWQKPEQGEVFVVPGSCWVNDIVPIRQVDFQRGTIHLARALRPYSESLGAAVRLRAGNRFRVENLLEDLTEPGEWCLDRDTGTVYFRPPAGDFDPDGVSAPFADSLIRLSGQPGRPVRHVAIRGLTFTQTQSGFPGEQVYYKTPNAAQTVYLENAEDCRIEDCRFDAVGGDAIRLQHANARCTIAGNEIAHAGAYGIFLGSFQQGFSHHDTRSGDVPNPPRWHTHPEEREPTALAWPRSPGHVITDNHIHHVGVYEKHACGICFFGVSAPEVRVAHNLIEHTPRFGIGLLSGFGRVIVEYNDLRYLSEETCDTGGIVSNRWYTWEGDPDLAKGCIVRFNRVRDVIGCGAYGTKAEPGGTDHAGGRIWSLYYGWGIYFDNAPMETQVYGNICARNTLGGIMISHYGRNVTVENNIFVDSAKSQVYLLFAGPESGIRLRRNLFVWTRADADFVRLNLAPGVDLGQTIAECDGNLLCPPPGGEITFSGSPGEAVKRIGMAVGEGGLTFAQWRALGFDNHSMLADPGFVDPAADNYELKPDSPALKMGFEPIDTSRIGPRRRKDRQGS